MPSEAVTMIGETNFRSQRRGFGIKPDDRRRHLYVVGKTGVGKSTLLATMIVQDIQNGQGLAVVDPHGDLAADMLEYVPGSRTNDVIYFDPSDAEFPIAFNVLETVGPDDPRFAQEKNLVSSGLVGVFKKLWADSWGPRLEYILRNTILALIDSPGNTLLGIMRMLVDKNFRRGIVENIRDPVVKSFWVDEFAQYNERFRSEAISPIQNKVGQFLSSSIIRNIVGQPKSTIDLREVMDNGKVFIMNLSKGKIGEDNAALLGAMMITKIQLAAMDRARMPEAERQDFYLYVDEFQNFATESFASILSEARKYRLNIIMAHQYITQMVEEVRDAVFGNVGTMICFRVGAYDAEYLEPEFAPHFTETDLVNLDKYHAYVKLMIDGIASKPFSMTTVPFGSTVPYFGAREKITQVSRERYGRARSVVEEKISRWSSATFRQAAEEESAAYDGERSRELRERGLPAAASRQAGQPAAPERSPSSGARPRAERPPKRQSPKPHAASAEKLEDVVIAPPSEAEAIVNLETTLGTSEEPKRLKRAYPTTCDRCGRATEVPFEPTPGKEKYCVDCLAIVRAERRKAPALRSESARQGGGSARPPVPPVPRPGDDWKDPERT